jgi:hypothetical protein
MSDPTLADRFEDYLTEEADALTAEVWMPWARRQTPALDAAAGTDAMLNAFLEKMEAGGMTPDVMRWCAREHRRAEREGLDTARRWMRDLFDRLLGEHLNRRVWAQARTQAGDLDKPMELEDFLSFHRTIEQALGSRQKLHDLTEEARLHVGMPGRN